MKARYLLVVLMLCGCLEVEIYRRMSVQEVFRDSVEEARIWCLHEAGDGPGLKSRGRDLFQVKAVYTDWYKERPGMDLGGLFDALWEPWPFPAGDRKE